MKRENPLKNFYEIIDQGDVEKKVNNMPEFPRIIELEITNICNFHCIMCKTGMDIAQRNKGIMTEEIFNILLAELKGKKTAIKFVGLGESLINPAFIKFATMAKENGIVCHLTTNGSLLTEELMKQLIAIKFDSIKFSFQGVDHESYAVMRQREDYEELLLKIENLKRLRGENELPYITVCTSVTDESEDKISHFKKQCKDICDKVEVGTTSLEFMEIDKIKDERYKKIIVDLQKKQTLNKIRYKCCNQIFDVITVRWNGDVSACCADGDGVMKLGNLKENTIAELWICPKQQKYREILAQNKYEELPLCKNCYDYMGYMGSNNKRL